MTILPFVRQPHIATDKRAEIEALARELGGVVIWPSRRKTARDCVLDVLGSRVALTTAQIATAANVSYHYTQDILTALRRDGVIVREKSRRYGGWLLTSPLEKAA